VSLWRQFTRGLRVLADRRAADQEIADEVSHYLDEATAAYVRKGLSPDEARRAARLELGGTTAVREQVRAYGWENALDAIVADFRYAVRRLGSAPGFTAASLLTLALGIGASTAVFSVVSAVLLRALPYPNPERIVRVWEQAPDGHRMNLAEPNFQDFRAQNITCAHLGEYGYFVSSVSGGSETVRVNVAAVSSGFFESLEVMPFRGRGFASEELRPHGSPAAIVSYGYWQQYLGAATALSPLRLRLEGAVYPVIGVMPQGFDFPPGVSVWIPPDFEPEPSRTAHNWRGIGRLRDGVTVAQARMDLSGIAHRIRDQYGTKVNLNAAAVVPLADAMVGDVRTALLTLLAAVGLLLLVACTNVAALLLARTSARRKELAVRAVLGAGRGRLIQQFLAESFTLSFAGGILGVFLAASTIRILPAILPANLPRQEGIAMSAPVLLFALAATLAVAVSLGLFAAWRAAKGDLRDALTAGSRSYSGTGAMQRLRDLLVIGEIAATLVILAGAGLLGRSFLWLVSTDPGFSPRDLITMEFSLPPSQGDVATDQTAIASQIQWIDGILTRLRAIPGTRGVGLAGAMPVAGGDDLADGTFLLLNGQQTPTSEEEFDRIAQNPAHTGHAEYCVAGASYFRALGISLIRGRMFEERDDWNAAHVALISESLARQRWPGQDPIGQMVEFGNMDGNPKPLTIIGIVRDVRASGLDLPPSPIIYVDYHQRGLRAASSPTILLRSAASPGQIVPAARGIFRNLAPDVPVKFSTFMEEMGGWLADRRFLLLLVGFFAATALVLAAVGVYGVVAFSVARRTQDVGIRMALGAQREDILGLIVGYGARLAVAGVVVGTAASLAITRLLSSLLFGVTATDPITFIGVAVLLSLVTLLASYVPALRATRLDPNTALRYE